MLSRRRSLISPFVHRGGLARPPHGAGQRALSQFAHLARDEERHSLRGHALLGRPQGEHLRARQRHVALLCLSIFLHVFLRGIWRSFALAWSTLRRKRTRAFASPSLVLIDAHCASSASFIPAVATIILSWHL